MKANELQLDVNPRSDDEPIDLRAYWRVLLKHKFTILGFGLLFALVAALYVMKLKPVYQSEATLLIEPEAGQVVSIEEVYGVRGDYEYYQTQYEILRSRVLIEQVVDKLNLSERPEFNRKQKTEPGFFDCDFAGFDFNPVFCRKNLTGCDNYRQLGGKV